MIVILLGPPGVGKGTQAKLLSNKRQFKTLSTGMILRKAISEKSQLGLKVKESINKGHLVSDDIICNLVENEITNDHSSVSYILDGFPRTINQAKYINLFCQRNNIFHLYVIFLNLVKEQIIKRLSSRVFCSLCNQGYNLVTNPMKVSKTCDTCKNNNFYRREDDKEESIKKRLKEYYQQTKPLITFYNNYAKYLYLEADTSIVQIQNRILNFLY